MNRFCLRIEYNGGPYVGFQRQSNGISIQSVLEDAFFQLTRERQTFFSAGRTDAGVHGIGQMVHVDVTDEAWTAYRLCAGMNHFLRPHSVGVANVIPVPDTFHARFSARGRSYLYRILNRKFPSPLESGRSLHISDPLDTNAMITAAAHLIGHHDFSTFRASHCQAASALKTLTTLSIHTRGNFIGIYAAAPSFLHHQVRNMVGSLIMVGQRKWEPDYLKTALNLRTRSAGGPTAAAHGLYFLHVDYGDSVAASAPTDPLTFL